MLYIYFITSRSFCQAISSQFIHRNQTFVTFNKNSQRDLVIMTFDFSPKTNQLFTLENRQEKGRPKASRFLKEIKEKKLSSCRNTALFICLYFNSFFPRCQGVLTNIVVLNKSCSLFLCVLPSSLIHGSARQNRTCRHRALRRARSSRNRFRPSCR